MNKLWKIRLSKTKKENLKILVELCLLIWKVLYKRICIAKF